VSFDELLIALDRQGIRDERVIDALRRAPRAHFLSAREQDQADLDRPVDIGSGQTCSQPFVVARMTELLALGGKERVLEIGTGSGWQTAILALLAREVYSIEIVADLHERAREALAKLGLANVHLRLGDGYAGWPEEAPFDRIIITAAPPEVPAPLLDQLGRGGRMVVPVGGRDEPQMLEVIERDPAGLLHRRDVFAVRFVPMTGQAERML
jgi:protein-L-isoaspartate(D-aspartate) O-methyltransferase